MQNLTPEGQRILNDIAARYNISTFAAETMLIAVNAGGGSQAQFNCNELGGMGQWSYGGMTMVGDMFNNGLKNTVSNLCTELSDALRSTQFFPPPPPPVYATSNQSQSQGNSFSMSGQQSGWPTDLGQISSSGSQNNLRYAVFPNTRRLAIDTGGAMRIYDIGDHQIGGFSQQQGGDQSITFTSQYGMIRVADLPEVTPGLAPKQQQPAPQPSPQSIPPMEQQPQSSPDVDQIFTLIGKLAELKSSGILNDAEFETKKAELLARI